MVQLPQALMEFEKFRTALILASQVVHGSATTVVTTEAGPIPTLAKIIADIQAAWDAAAVVTNVQALVTTAEIARDATQQLKTDVEDLVDSADDLYLQMQQAETRINNKEAALSAVAGTLDTKAQTILDAATNAATQTALGAANVASALDANAQVQTTKQQVIAAALQATGVSDLFSAMWAAVAAGFETLPFITSDLHYGPVVDTFIYNVGDDTDSGDWTKRCQHTAWYNDAINGTWLKRAKDELTARGDNLLLNSDWTNLVGTLPNTWAWGASLPEGTFGKSTLFKDENAFTFSQTANRSFIQKGNFTLAAFTTYVQSVQVEAVTGTVTVNQVLNAVTMPTGATWFYRLNGVSVADTATVTTGLLEFVILNGATASSTVSMRFGLGVNGNATGTIRLSRPKINLLSNSVNASMPELLINPGFDSGLTGWTVTTGGGGSVAVTNGVAVVTGGGAGNTYIGQGFTTVVGKVYVVKVDNPGGSTLSLNIGTALNGSQTLNTSVPIGGKDVMFAFVATATMHYIGTLRNAVGTVSMDNVSVKEAAALSTPYVPWSKVAGAYYQNTTDGKYYALSTVNGYGQTETWRGNRRDIPSSIAWVGEAGRLIGYSLDTPDCPMWMVLYPGGTGVASEDYWRSGRSLTCISAMQGRVYFGTSTGSSDGAAGLCFIDFPRDIIGRYANAATNGGIVPYSAHRSRAVDDSLPALSANSAASGIMDVSLTVQPDAPVDPFTGLQVPTVGVATAGGLVIIRNDGSVVYGSTTQSYKKVSWNKNFDLIADRTSGSSNVDIVRNAPSITTSPFGLTVTAAYGSGGIPSAIPTYSQTQATMTGKESLLGKGSAIGLQFIRENPTVLAKGMAAMITNVYNTGWQVGDSRLAALSDTVAETLIGTELVTNGKFDQDTTGWSAGSFATIALDTNRLRVNGISTNPAENGVGSQAIANLTIGKTYTLVADLTVGSGGLGIGIGTGPASTANFFSGYSATTRQVSTSFVAAATTHWINCFVDTVDGTQYGFFDNISLKESAGVELISGGKFDPSLNGWNVLIQGGTANVALVGTSVQLTGDGVNEGRISQILTTVAGWTYTLSLDVSGVQCGVRIGTVSNGTQLYGNAGVSVGSQSYTFTATTTTTHLTIFKFAAGTSTVDNITVTPLYGPELLSNGTFNTNISGWLGGSTGTVGSWNADGSLRVALSGTSTITARVYQNITTVPGKMYQMTANFLGSNIQGGIYVNLTGGGGLTGGYSSGALTTPQLVTINFMATGTLCGICLNASFENTLTNYADFDNVSVKEIPNLILNPEFRNDLSFWNVVPSGTGTAIWDAGVAKITGDGTLSYISQGFTTVAGNIYQLTFDVASNPAVVRVGTSQVSSDIASNGSISPGIGLTLTFTATGNFTYVMFGKITATTTSIDNVSIKNITNMVANGNFEGDIAAGWNAQYGNITTVAGSLRIMATGAGATARAWKQFATVAGKVYTLKATLKGGTSAAFLTWNATGGNSITQANDTAGIGGTKAGSITFTAQSSLTSVVLYINNTTIGTYADFDDISCTDTREVILNGRFDTDISAWTGAYGTVSWQSGTGKLRVQGDGTTGVTLVRAYQSFTTVVGRIYTVTADIDAANSGAGGTDLPAVYIQPNNGSSISGAVYRTVASNTSGSVSFTFRATGTATTIILGGNTVVGGYVDFDNVSVTENIELVPNGKFEGLTTGWSVNFGQGTMECTNGQLVLTRNNDGDSIFGQTLAVTNGRSYNISFDIVANTGGVSFQAPGINTGYLNTTGRQTYTFVATSSTATIGFQKGGTLNQTTTLDNITVKLAELDRSTKANHFNVNGTINKVAVATGSQLMCYTNFSAANFFDQLYSANYDFGTGDYHYMWWMNVPAGTSYSTVFQRKGSRDVALDTGTAGTMRYVIAGQGILTGAKVVQDSQWHQALIVRRAGVTCLYVDGVLDVSISSAFNASMTDTDAPFYIGRNATGNANLGSTGKMTLFRASATAPSDDQIRFMYDTEKRMFEPGAQVALVNSPNVVSIDHDPTTNLMHVCTTDTRHGFADLVRVESEASGVGTISGIFATGGSVVTGGSTGARISMPAVILRDELKRKSAAKKAQARIPTTFDVDCIGFTATTTTGSANLTNVAVTTGTPYVGMGVTGTGIPANAVIIAINGTTYTLSVNATANGTAVAMGQSTFVVPKGYSLNSPHAAVAVAGTRQRNGATKQYVVEYDGFVETAKFGVSPGNAAWVQLQAIRSVA